MSRYLNEGAIWSAVKRIPHITMQTRQAILEALRKVPSAHVAEVVFCEDCKYYQDNNNGYPTNECKWCKDETPNADDFCSYGERR